MKDPLLPRRVQSTPWSKQVIAVGTCASIQCSYLVLFQKINDIYGPVALALLKKTDSAQRETKIEHKQR